MENYIPESKDKRSRHSKAFYTTGAGGKRQAIKNTLHKAKSESMVGRLKAMIKQPASKEYFKKYGMPK